MINNHGDPRSPKLVLWDPFQMAEPHGLLVGGDDPNHSSNCFIKPDPSLEDHPTGCRWWLGWGVIMYKIQ